MKDKYIVIDIEYVSFYQDDMCFIMRVRIHRSCLLIGCHGLSYTSIQDLKPTYASSGIQNSNTKC